MKHGTHVAAIAVGSNVGDRYAHIEKALGEIERSMTVTGTSFLYESTPMYVLDQPHFLNCAITVETTLDPRGLLAVLKSVEAAMGRVAGPRNGPRALDLDIVFYDSVVLDTRTDGGDGSRPGELVVPHPRLSEREFVLRPLADLVPEYVHPCLHTPVRALLAAHAARHASALRRVLPFPPPPHLPLAPATLWPLAARTYLMAAVNASPDSFSAAPADEGSGALADALAAAAAGADMLDVGGYSTRPGAAHVAPADELRRVVPVVRALRAHGVALPISVDTFRPAVLRAAVAAGANCLNDVTALADEGMAAAVRELRVPVVMMHSRGAHRAGEDAEYGDGEAGAGDDSEAGGVVAGVRRELGVRVAAALRAGVRRWHVVVDPGFGFSKTPAGNVALLRGLARLTAPGAGAEPLSTAPCANPLAGFPTLAGVSRKSFLGALLPRPTAPREREWATAAAVAAAVQQGADVVRVHDVAVMRDVVRVADAVWREGR